MAELVSVSVVDSSTMPATVVDVSEGVIPETPQTPEETVGQDALVMIEGDDSVFYSDDEDASQQGFSSICNSQPPSAGPVCPAELCSALICDARLEGSVCQSDAVPEDKPNHLSLPVTCQGVQDKMETASSTSTTRSEELPKFSTAQSTQSSTQQKMENSLMLPGPVESDPHSEQAAGPHGRAATQELENPSSILCGDDVLKSVGREEPEEGHASDTPNDLGNGLRMEKSFDHLTHEKYGTVSYRQIRRGHTRQRIREFESMMQL